MYLLEEVVHMPRTSNRGPYSSSNGAIANLIREIQLAWLLLRDARVPVYAKALPVLLVVIYVLFPIDVLPDPILGLGQLDDLGIFLLGLAIFRALVPNYILEEYSGKVSRRKVKPQRSTQTNEDYIDAEYRVLHDDE